METFLFKLKVEKYAILINIAFSYLGNFHIVPFAFVGIVLEATTFSTGAFTL